MGRGAVAPSHGKHLVWEGRADTAGTAGIHTSTAPTCQSQGSSNTCPVLLLIPVIPMALAAGWQEEPTLLQSVPTAPFGDGPSHGRSHDWACRRRHGQGIPPGHAAVWERSHKSRLQEEPWMPVGRCCSVVSPMPVWTWGHDKHSSSSGKKIPICFREQRFT